MKKVMLMITLIIFFGISCGSEITQDYNDNSDIVLLLLLIIPFIFLNIFKR